MSTLHLVPYGPDVRAMILGDTHGDIKFVEWAFEKAYDYECDLIIQVGDFGYFPKFESGQRFLQTVDNLTHMFDIDFYFLDGNHDDHDGRLYIQDNVKIGDRFTYLARGDMIDVLGTNIMAVGGAWSIDQKYRTKFVDWWPNETVSEAEIDDAIETGQFVGGVDILLTHDVPATCDIGEVVRQKLNKGILINQECHDNRYQLDRVYREFQPKTVIHGHWHMKHRTEFNGSDFIGLDCNMNPAESFCLIDFVSGSYSVIYR